MLWFGCAPDQSACCLYDSFCRPCGWTACPFVPKGAPPPTTLPPGCPTYYVLDKPPATVPLECQPYEPNDTKFCWDDAPPEWKTYDFHIYDDQ